jgi:glutathionylspermidine synthase
MLDGLSCGERLSRSAFAEVKERAVREAFKWNIAHHGDDTLCDFPLLVTQALWDALSAWAERLGAEAEIAGRELCDRPLIAAAAGIPWRLCRALHEHGMRRGIRYARFDFHPTLDGEPAITEGNLDVAGGWNESSAVTRIFAEYDTAAEPAGDPAAALAESLARRLFPGAAVGVMHLTRYADDHQVARFLARVFERRGLVAVPFDPTQLRAYGRQAGALVGDRVRPLDAVFRFFPAEWACRLPSPDAWLDVVARPGTLWLNPMATVLTQSKRFPLTWRHLRNELPTWSRLLPETRDPMFSPSRGRVLKPALGHEGFDVTIDGVTDARSLRARWWRARLQPWRWAAQRKFRPRLLETPHGPRFPCLGVYLVDGRAAGMYGRLARRPLIDGNAQDAVVLIRR